MHDSDSDGLREDLTLLDLISLEELQQLQDTLADIHHVASVITDTRGNLVTIPSNDDSLCQLICTSSQNASGAAAESLSTRKMRKMDVPQYCPVCRRIGILKAAIPIVIQDIHLADWWVSQFCGETPARKQLASYAEKLGMDVEALDEVIRHLPIGNETDFHKITGWIRSLSHQITRWVYENHILSRNLSKLNLMENELDRHRFEMESQVQERTAELIKANKRLQLEVMERDLAEEQTERKSRLLDAINLIFQQTLKDKSDSSLARTFLKSAQQLTDSPFGFIAEQKEGRWQVSAIHQRRQADESGRATIKPDVSEISDLWRQLVTDGKPLSLPGIDHAFQMKPLPKSCPDMRSFLAVPLSKDQYISGFVAVANKRDGYALVDQNDVEALAQAFIETLLRKRTEADKAKSESRLNLALESANEGLWDYNPVSGHIYYSPRWFSMLGYTPGEYPETLETWSTLTHPEDLPVLEEELQSVAAGERVAFNIEVRMLSNSGRWRWLQVRGRMVGSGDEEKVNRIVGTLIDVSKFKQVEVALQKANNELQRLAALDDLTQIANRRRFEERLAQEWRRGQRDNKSLAVIICDIDYFKNYNDTYGHLKGDETLYAVAQTISSALKRPMDLVARIGGEEFAMILPNTGIDGAGRVAEEVKAAIVALQIEHKSSQVNKYITLSFGVAAVSPAPDLAAKVLIEKADQALYRAKSEGRNQIYCISMEEEKEE